MAGEHLFYSNNPFAPYRIDEEGRIIDSINGQIIGICSQKKKEILDDYNALAKENLEFKSKIDEIYKLLEKFQDILPAELKKIIEKPPTVEDLQGEILGFKNEIYDLKAMISTLINERRVANNDNSRPVQKPWAKPESPAGGRSETSGNGDKSEQSQRC